MYETTFGPEWLAELATERHRDDHQHLVGVSDMSPRKPRKSKRRSRNAMSDSPRERREMAQRVIDRAFEEEDPRQQMALARSAIEISHDCADGFFILAEHAPSDEEAMSLYEKAVAAGARVIGEVRFREYTGHFWEVPDTRPYMRAKLELAECLWAADRVGEAIDHFQEMLILNPNDNQGCRYRLASMLLKSDRLDELRELLERYPDDDLAEWNYTRALLVFKIQGDTEESCSLLRSAEKGNQHVPAFLTGAKQLPREPPEFISPGEETEAISYAAEFLSAWRETPGAIPWLRKTLNVPMASPPPRRPVPWSRIKPVLQQLPQADDVVWEVDLVSLPAIPQSRDKPWVFLIVDATTAQPLCLEISDERPSDADLWREVITTMRQPKDAEPSRPDAIRLSRKTLHRTWGSKLEQIGITCHLTDELVQIPAVINDCLSSVRESGPLDGESLPADVTELESFPQQIGDVWLGSVGKLPAWIQVEGKMCRPTVLMVVDATNDLILTTELTQNEPPADWLWTGIQSAICRPVVGEPHRPGVVQVSSDEELFDLGPRLESIGVRCVANDDSRKIDEMLADLSERVAGSRRMKSLVGSPGVTRDQLDGFFAAAADFYRQAPWRRIPADTIIRIETDAFSSRIWYAVVMGQMGMQLGIALYEDLELLQEILTGRMSEQETARRTSALSLTFGEAFDISPEDYDAIEKHGWPVAAEEAYPSVMRVNPGFAIRTPLSWEIDLLEGCLRALPSFLENGDLAVTSPTIKTSTREMPLHLSLLD